MRGEVLVQSYEFRVMRGNFFSLELRVMSYEGFFFSLEL
jgi:hypothetical protein